MAAAACMARIVFGLGVRRLRRGTGADARVSLRAAAWQRRHLAGIVEGATNECGISGLSGKARGCGVEVRGGRQQGRVPAVHKVVGWTAEAGGGGREVEE